MFEFGYDLCLRKASETFFSSIMWLRLWFEEVMNGWVCYKWFSVKIEHSQISKLLYLQADVKWLERSL